MRIQRLDIKGFGKFNDLKLEFKDGFNVVYGKNESGKTTLQWFIKGMLYGLKGGRSGKDGSLPPSKRFKPWNSKDYSGILEYRLENGEAFRVGRNFSNNSVNIYDSLFNDLTQQFEMSRERGALFAEKQLGMNENCFEKTVLIRQMETRIDEEGSKELLNRLTNVMETGFEDISCRKAEEALKEALKTGIGTGKTTTRPLDKINSRLDELVALKNEINQKRLDLMETQQKLNSSKDSRSELDSKKQLLIRIKGYLEIRNELEQLKGKKAVLEEAISRMSSAENERSTAGKEVSRIDSEKTRLSGFSAFGNEEVDSITIDYNNLKELCSENEALAVQIQQKKEALDSINASIEHLKSFEIPGTDTEAIRLAAELENIESDKSKAEYENINEIIKDLGNAKKKTGLGALLLGAASVAALAAGLISAKGFIWYIAFGVLFACAAVCTGFYLKSSKGYKDAAGKKKISFIYSRDISEQIEKARQRLNEKLGSVGASTMEEYLRLKSVYDKSILEIRLLESSLQNLQKTIEKNENRISQFKEGIQQKLSAAGIELSSEGITEGKIIEFKNNIRAYKDLEPSLEYARKRLSSINNEKESIKSLLKPYGIEVEETSRLEALRNDLDQNIKTLEDKELQLHKSLEADLANTALPEAAISTVNSEGQGASAALSLQTIADLLEEVNKEISDLSLEMRRLETLLESTEADNDSLQKIEEEASDLEQKKEQLTNISLSIRTALEVLVEASSEIQKDFVPVLNDKMSKIIDKISLGRYLDLRANDQLTLNVIAPETGGVVPASILSSGTTDQMYLALRLAMADFITSGNEKLPLLLDEVFSQFDDIRTAKTLELLERLAEDTQVILFTCKQRELEAVSEQFGDNLNKIILP